MPCNEVLACWFARVTVTLEDVLRQHNLGTLRGRYNPHVSGVQCAAWRVAGCRAGVGSGKGGPAAAAVLASSTPHGFAHFWGRLEFGEYQPGLDRGDLRLTAAIPPSQGLGVCEQGCNRAGQNVRDG